MDNIERLLSDAHESIMNKLGELQQANQTELDACREENRQLRLGIHVPVINPKLAPNAKFIPFENGEHLRKVPNNGFSLVNTHYHPNNQFDPFQICPDLYKYTIYERVTHPRDGFDALGKIIDGVKTLTLGGYEPKANSVPLRFINKADIEYIQTISSGDMRYAAKYTKNGREVHLYYDPNEPNVNELYVAEENAKKENLRLRTEKTEKYIQEEVMKERAKWDARKTKDNPLGRLANARFEPSPFDPTPFVDSGFGNNEFGDPFGYVDSNGNTGFNYANYNQFDQGFGGPPNNGKSDYENRLRQQLSDPSQRNASAFDGKGRTKRKRRNNRTKKHKDKLRK